MGEVVSENPSHVAGADLFQVSDCLLFVPVQFGQSQFQRRITRPVPDHDHAVALPIRYCFLLCLLVSHLKLRHFAVVHAGSGFDVVLHGVCGTVEAGFGGHLPEVGVIEGVCHAWGRRPVLAREGKMTIADGNGALFLLSPNFNLPRTKRTVPFIQ